MNSNIVNVGDKVDIRILQQVERKDQSDTIPKVYKSSVQDIKPAGLFEIAMPIYGGKMVLLSAGLRYECVFYTRKGLYRCIVQVKERYKSEGLYMLLMEPKTPLEKFQRREYFRFECAMDIDYCKITAEEAAIEKIENLKEQHFSSQPDAVMNKGIAVDLSGGGIRFVAEEEGKRGEYLLISIFLRSIDVNQLLEFSGRVLSCKRIEGERGAKRYEYRVQFLTRDQKKRETIIKYIFEQERKNRQKG